MKNLLALFLLFLVVSSVRAEAGLFTGLHHVRFVKTVDKSKQIRIDEYKVKKVQGIDRTPSLFLNFGGPGLAITFPTLEERLAFQAKLKTRTSFDIEINSNDPGVYGVPQHVFHGMHLITGPIVIPDIVYAPSSSVSLRQMPRLSFCSRVLAALGLINAPSLQNN